MNGTDLYRQMTRAWQQARDAVKLTQAAHVRVREVLGNALMAGAPGVTGLLREMDAAAARFEAAVDAPEVTIATTGTTSGGKSTLINFLIGAPIMPVSVDEMSAGVVSIVHSPNVRSVTVQETEGATWDVGDWRDLSDADIESRLRITMEAWRGARAAGLRLPAPICVVRYPTRVGSNPEILGLPSTVRLRLLDLPGLNSMADDANADVIRQGTLNALCLMAYNSEETDRAKQRLLLGQVVDQVKELRSSPARMLFILNRIDAFRRDENWEGRQDDFIRRTTNAIRESLAEGLPNFASIVGHISPTPFSSGPAALCVLAQRASGPAQERALHDLRKKYAYLASDRWLESPVSTWSAADRKAFIAEVGDAAYLGVFERRLARHIADHLPELVLPHLIHHVRQPALGVLAELEAMVQAYRHTTVQALDAERAAIDRVDGHLADVKREVLTLLDPFRKLCESADPSEAAAALATAAQTVASSLKLDPEFLHALHDGADMFGRRARALHEPLLGVEGAEWPALLGQHAREELERALSSALAGPAGPYLRMPQGGTLKADLAQVELARKHLQALGRALAAATNELIDRESETQSHRIQEALSALLSHLAGRLSGMAEAARPDLVGLRVPVPSAAWNERPALGGLAFNPDIEKWSHSRTVSEQRKTGYRRLWYTLWLAKEAVYETFSYEVTDHYCKVPSMDALLAAFMATAQFERFDGQLLRHITKQIGVFDREATRHYEDAVARYRRHLQAAYVDVEGRSHDFADRVGALTPVLSEAAQALERAATWR
jgi:hypothetical protein